MEKKILSENILNENLPWDGSYIGTYPLSSILYKWKLEKTLYFKILLNDKDIIYCIPHKTKSKLPCIIDQIKEFFKIQKRGIHQIILGKSNYVIFYVPITKYGEIIWETPLNRLKKDHFLRKDPFVCKKIQYLIVFCDILALSNTEESFIRIRDYDNIINFNFKINSLNKEEIYDFTIISKSLYKKWFGEENDIKDTVKEMFDYKDNIDIISYDLREKINEIIKKFDSNYIWYSYFIIDRLSRYLLNI